MTATYLMQARENFDPTNQALVDGGAVNTPPYNQLSNTNNQVVGTAYDRARGKIMYVAFNGQAVDGNSADYYNLTGYTLWDGIQAFAPNAPMNMFSNISPYIGEKDVNTDAVKWYPTYDPTKTVPTTIAPRSGFGNAVYLVVVTNAGTGYTHASASFSGGGGTGASATLLTEAQDIFSYFFIDTSGPGIFYYAVIPNGLPYVPDANVTQSAYPYATGYTVSFIALGGSLPLFNIGPISYTILIKSNSDSGVPTVTITNFGLATGGVTFTTSLVDGSSSIYQVTVEQIFPGGVALNALVSGGTGYTSPPTVTITGDGIGATATAYVTQGITTPGTWRRTAVDFSPRGGNDPVVVDPHPGSNQSNCWVHSESCHLYQLRYSDNFAQVISPYIYLTSATENSADSPMVRVFGIDATWVYCIVTPSNTTLPMAALLVIPAAITADEVAFDNKLAYAIYTTPPFISDLGVRTVLGTDGNMYLFSIFGTGTTLTFRLTQFQPPPFSTYIPGSNIAGGTFTDVTPWDATHGPNLDGENYGDFGGPQPSWFSYISFFRLPAALNEAVAICKFLKGQSTAGSPTYANTLFGCLNLKLGASPSYDYHSAFVTGYMSSTWTTLGSIPVTGYAVVNYRELDVYFEQSDYVYPGVDYSKRWLYFDCYPIVGSTVITAGGLKVVMVQYQFAYGSPPTVLQVIPEDGWDTTYATYGIAIGKTFVVENSLWKDKNYGGSIGYTSILRDAGITLGTDTVPIWWWSGQVDDNLDTASNNVMLLNPMFAPRINYTSPTVPQGDIISPLDAPFLRLTYNPSGGGGGSATRGSQGHIY